jgi:hypothetical protein
MTRLPLRLLCVALAAGCLTDEDPPEAARSAPAAAPTPADLDQLCAGRTAEGEQRALAAQEQVQSLQSQIGDRERALAELEAAARQDEKRAAAAASERKKLQAELDGLKAQLRDAETVRDEARAELVATLKRLDVQIAETERLKVEADTQRGRANRGEWSAFVAQAKVEICDRGGRRKHERCHGAVQSGLNAAFEERFTRCVDAGQAAPELRELTRDAEPPAFAVVVPFDDSVIKDRWAVVFCDPALPEQGGDAPAGTDDAAPPAP